MAFHASSNVAADTQTVLGECSSLDLARERPTADAATQNIVSAPPQEQSRNDRLRTVTTEDLTAVVLVHANSSKVQSRAGKKSVASRISRKGLGPLPTMPSLPTSSQFRLASVVVGAGPSHQHHCARLIASSTMTAQGIPTNVGVCVQRHVENNKVTTQIPLQRLGLPPPPKLANILQVPSSIPHGTNTAAQETNSNGKKRKESWGSNCENSTSAAVLDPPSTVCFARSYFTTSNSTRKRVRSSTRSAKNAALVVEVRSEQQETRRVIEAAMALSSIGLRDGRSLVPTVILDP